MDDKIAIIATAAMITLISGVVHLRHLMSEQARLKREMLNLDVASVEREAAIWEAEPTNNGQKAVGAPAARTELRWLTGLMYVLLAVSIALCSWQLWTLIDLWLSAPRVTLIATGTLAYAVFIAASLWLGWSIWVQDRMRRELEAELTSHQSGVTHLIETVGS